jgi:hypothetical protein
MTEHSSDLRSDVADWVKKAEEDWVDWVHRGIETTTPTAPRAPITHRL